MQYNRQYKQGRTVVDVCNGKAPAGPVLVAQVEQGGGSTGRAAMDLHQLRVCERMGLGVGVYDAVWWMQRIGNSW